ncbi:partial [Paramuricea clavata]|uniref:Partial n=1 Tax=Paramuricea clavata TaxID=317549 RepID=A0A7D9I6K1_PARCT|nr:partial [Paramuricea clavata]
MFQDTDYNFALLKPTAQSSTLRHSDVGYFLSKYAVDGIKADSCKTTGIASCAHLSSVENQWWRVDFQILIPVARVVFTNRKDYPGHNGLANFEIKIGNSLENEGRNNPKCGGQHSVPHAETKEISCLPPLIGRYLVVQSFHSQLLLIIEIEVFAAGL